ncbi:MAG TPA: hypothetical protein ENH28_02465, partial [Euryarchaeota archaeon]|nr:hypothetical protein [Euryarchaeota archaeon]
MRQKKNWIHLQNSILLRKIHGGFMQGMFKKIAFLILVLLIMPCITFAKTMPVPTGQQSFSYSPAALPILPINSLDFTQATPIGVGSVATGGDTISIQVGLNQFAGPVDIYLGIYAPAIDPNIWIIKPDLSLQPVSDGLVPWKAGTTGPINESLYGDILASGLPQGIYYLYLAVTPAGSIERFFLWETYFTINSPPPPQSSTTGDEGKATFLTTQGQTLTFVVNDKDTQQALPDIFVTFVEGQNNSVITIFEDPSGKHIPTLYVDSMPTKSQSATSKNKIKVIDPITAQIGLCLITTGATAIYKEAEGIKYVNDLIKDTNLIGVLENVRCMSVRKYAELVQKTGSELDKGLSLLAGMVGAFTCVDPSITANNMAFSITSAIYNVPAEDVIENITTQLYNNGNGVIRNPSSDELVAVEFYLADKSLSILRTYVEKAYRVLPVEYCGDKVAPSDPTNLNATAISSNQIELTWTDTPNEVGYIIEYSLDEITFNPVPLSINKDLTSFSHQFLSSNTTYYYRIYALNSAGLSGYSNIAQATTLPTQNQAPAISSVTANPSSVNTGDTSTVTCNASDSDGDALTYIWTRTGGNISGSGSVVSWTAPSIEGTYKVTCNVSDDKDGTASRKVNIAVNPVNTPTVASVTPNSGTQGQSLNVAIEGTNFTGATSVSFGSGITVNSFAVNSSTQITANISISSTATTGTRNVSVTTPAGTGTGNGLFTVVAATGGVLSVSPGDRFDSSGKEGGPFSPSRKTYTLSNTGGSSINWTASKTHNWVSLSQTSGTLAPSGSTTVTVTINSSANSLTPNNYVDIVAFTNTANGNGNTTRTVNLSVNYSTPTITVGPASLNFGDVQVETCNTAVFAIQHVTGTGPASGTVSTNPNPPFSITSGSSFSVSNGSAANVTVQFCPTSTGNFSGNAKVSSSATFTGTDTVTLTGAGVSTPTPPSVTTGTYQIASSSSAQLFGTVN